MLAERTIFKEKLYSPRLKPKFYPPSVLLISDHPGRALNIEQFLTDNGCRVCRIDIRGDRLDTVRQNYFEMLLLDVQTPQTSLRAWAEIGAQPELSSLPVILLTSGDCSEAAARQLKPGHIYCLSHNAADERLLTLVQQIAYMTERYI